MLHHLLLTAFKSTARGQILADTDFLGQVRADTIDNKKVASIEYTAYEEMALEKMHKIREDIFSKYELTCMHVYHSWVKWRQEK